MRVLVASLIVGSVVVLPGCQMNERLSGTVMGGVGGAALGGIATSTFGGAVVGGAVGALAGYLIGDYMADQRERGVGMANRWGGSGSATDVPVAAKAAYEKGQRAATAEEARASYMEAVRLDPARPEPYNALGVSVLASGDRGGARSYFRKALEVDPTYAPATRNLALLDTPR